MRITAYNQITENITMTPSSENVAYPKANIYDTYGTQVFKFTGYTDENIVFDAGSGNTIQFNSMAIVNHNLTSAATITIQGNATDSWGTPSFSKTVTWREYMTYDFFASTSNYRYARLRVQDATNTVPIQIGYIMLGVYIQMPGFDPAVQITDSVDATSYISDSGQAGGNKRFSYRSIRIAMNDFSNAQRQTIRTLITTNGSFQPCAAVLWESDFTKELPLYCVLEQRKRFTQRDNNYNNFDTDFTLREVF